jgi:predicted dehydrogenase
MLKVAIVGCGKIADSHLEQLSRIPNCRVIAACDTEPLMARQLAERFKIPQHFSDLKEMLKVAAPDVVHVTTPPASHFPIARICLEAGSHVYVEKPFTLNTAEAEALIDLAEKKGTKITVGHDLQFSHAARRMRKLVEDGFLGGKPVHMESYYCYDLSNAKYARALLTNKQHWVRKLPGQLLHNVISHGIARIAEYLTTDSPQVIVCGFSSPLLSSMGECELTDELRVIINEENRTTAYFTFSSQMRPLLNAFRVYGPRNGLILDDEQQSVIPLRGAPYKSFAEKFIPPIYFAQKYLANLAANLRLFLRNDFHMKAGLKCLIESFYRSISDGTAPPIPYRQILLTSRIMDEIFRQLNAKNASRCGRETDANGMSSGVETAHASRGGVNGHSIMKPNTVRDA